MNNIIINETCVYIGEHYCMTKDECTLFVESGWERKPRTPSLYRLVWRIKNYSMENV